MKLPKKLAICGKTYTIKYDKSASGANFLCGRQVIVIGTKGSDELVLATMLHEIMEIVFVERNMRYENSRSEPDNGDYIFNFNHKEFESAVNDISGVLLQL